jgi:hypothetical protein
LVAGRFHYAVRSSTEAGGWNKIRSAEDFCPSTSGLSLLEGLTLPWMYLVGLRGWVACQAVSSLE